MSKELPPGSISISAHPSQDQTKRLSGSRRSGEQTLVLQEPSAAGGSNHDANGGDRDPQMSNNHQDPLSNYRLSQHGGAEGSNHAGAEGETKPVSQEDEVIVTVRNGSISVGVYPSQDQSKRSSGSRRSGDQTAVSQEPGAGGSNHDPNAPGSVHHAGSQSSSQQKRGSNCSEPPRTSSHGSEAPKEGSCSSVPPEPRRCSCTKEEEEDNEDRDKAGEGKEPIPGYITFEESLKDRRRCDSKPAPNKAKKHSASSPAERCGKKTSNLNSVNFCQIK